MCFYLIVFFTIEYTLYPDNIPIEYEWVSGSVDSS